MKTILHLGVHRTATTTFQDYLERNAMRLNGAGVAVWTPQTVRKGLFDGMIRAPHLRSPASEDATSMIEMAWRRLRRDQNTHLIVSEENMIGTIRTNMRDKCLYPELGPRLSRFATVFGENCARILMSIRSYDTFWMSSMDYAQGAGLARPNAGFGNRVLENPRRWRHVIRDVHRVFPKAEIVVLPYEDFGGNCDDMMDCALENNTISGMLVPSPLHHNSAQHDITSPFQMQTRQKLRRRYQQDLAWLADGAEGMARLHTQTDYARLHTQTDGARLHTQTDVEPQNTQTQNTDMDENGIVRLGIIQRRAKIGENDGTIRRMV